MKYRIGDPNQKLMMTRTHTKNKNPFQLVLVWPSQKLRELILWVGRSRRKGRQATLTLDPCPLTLRSILTLRPRPNILIEHSMVNSTVKLVFINLRMFTSSSDWPYIWVKGGYFSSKVFKAVCRLPKGNTLFL